MKIAKKWWPWLAVAAILMVVGLTTVATALVFSGGRSEDFQGGTPVSSALNALTAHERELFKNLQDNKFTNTQIDDMIQEGILNAKIVNKFLAALNVA